jgi:16S rRNA (uracil1498-N3)-methyltransferase
MQIRRFIVSAIPAAGAEVLLPEAEALHAGRVLRLRPGERVDLLDGSGVRAEGVLSQPGTGRRFVGMACRILRRESCREPTLNLRLYIAPPRARLMGDVIRAATELGVRRVTPILCALGVSRPDAGALEGWRQDMLAAAKQSGNPFFPLLDEPTAFAAALQNAAEPGIYGAAPAADAAARTAPLPMGTCLGVWIGPEGGFSAAEEQALAGRGFTALTVGPWILRVETAVPALLGRLWGEPAHA